MSLPPVPRFASSSTRSALSYVFDTRTPFAKRLARYAAGRVIRPSGHLAFGIGQSADPAGRVVDVRERPGRLVHRGALTDRIVRVRDRYRGRIDHRAEPAIGIIGGRVKARPVVEHRPAAVGVVGHRRPGAILILLAREPAGRIVHIARPQAPSIDPEHLAARGVELIRHQFPRASLVPVCLPSASHVKLVRFPLASMIASRCPTAS